MSAIFALACLVAVLAWAALGEQAARLLRSPAQFRAFNLAMAVLLIASMVPVLL
jgi:threonine/homoserine/homoserine lactone efflux protein